MGKLIRIQRDFSYLILSLVDYLAMISLCFVFLPFTYFYAEESLDCEDDIDFFDVED